MLREHPARRGKHLPIRRRVHGRAAHTQSDPVRATLESVLDSAFGAALRAQAVGKAHRRERDYQEAVHHEESAERTSKCAMRGIHTYLEEI